MAEPSLQCVPKDVSVSIKIPNKEAKDRFTTPLMRKFAGAEVSQGRTYKEQLYFEKYPTLLNIGF